MQVLVSAALEFEKKCHNYYTCTIQIIENFHNNGVVKLPEISADASLLLRDGDLFAFANSTEVLIIIPTPEAKNKNQY